MRFLFLIFLGVCVTSQAYSAPQWCAGKVTRIYLQADGGLYVFADYRKDYTQVCNTLTEWKGIKTEVCKGWMSILLANKMAGANTTIHYSNEPSCNLLPTYEQAPAPLYIMSKE